MNPAVVLSSTLSWSLYKMAAGQSPTAIEYQNSLHWSLASAVFYVCCSPLLLHVSMETSGVTSSQSVSSHTVSPSSGRRHIWLPYSSSLKFHSSLSPCASVLASDLSWVQGIHFPPSSPLCLAIFHCMDCNSQRGSSSIAYHFVIFPEVSTVDLSELPALTNNWLQNICPRFPITGVDYYHPLAIPMRGSIQWLAGITLYSVTNETFYFLVQTIKLNRI